MNLNSKSGAIYNQGGNNKFEASSRGASEEIEPFISTPTLKMPFMVKLSNHLVLRVNSACIRELHDYSF